MKYLWESFYNRKASDLHAVMCKTKPILYVLYRQFMIDIVSSGDNLHEKSKLYLLEKYEKCFAVFPRMSMYP